MGEFEYRLFKPNLGWLAWQPVKEGLIVTTMANTGDVSKIQFREKPSFEPGYFVDVSLVGEDRDRSSFADQPLRVVWLDEQPVGKGWERAVVYNDHLN